MTEKAKQGKVTQSSIHPLNFFLVWLIANIATTYLAAGILQWLYRFNFIQTFMSAESWHILLASSLLLSGGVAFIQKLVLRLAFRRSFNGWVLASLVGAVLSVLPLIMAPSMNTGFNYFTEILRAILVSLPLVWVLRRSVQRPWLLIISNILGMVFSGLFFANNYPSDFISLSAVGIRAAFVAVTMLWFFRTMYQPLRSASTSQNENHERLEDKLAEDSLLSEQEIRFQDSSGAL
jgi:hypothetical protein